MALQVIKVPDIGEGIAQVELVAWHVKPGDTVAEDQALADVMTDKATVEVPSPVAGQVIALGGEPGQVLAVGSELIRIERSASAACQTEAGSPAEARSAKAGVALTPGPSPASGRGEELLPSPTPVGEGPGVRGAASSPVSRAAGQGKPLASPAVRARAWELGVDLHAVTGSGPGGRILRSDLEAHAASPPGRADAGPPADAHSSQAGLPADAHSSQAGLPAEAHSSQAGLPAEAQSPDAGLPAEARSAQAGTHALKLIGLRRVIAQKMQESKRRIPHYTYVEEVDVTELESLRGELNAKWEARRGRLTFLPFLVQALVQAVREFPQVNARFDDEAGVLTRYDAVHAGIATQTDAGLMVPVLRDAQARDLWSCAARIAQLAAEARAGRIARDDLTGSTITITSLGRLGGIVSTPVINHPEVAIVGVNRIALRPAIVGGSVVARQMMNLSSSFDHRVIDGAQAAAFVQCVRGMLQQPALLFIGQGPHWPD